MLPVGSFSTDPELPAPELPQPQLFPELVEKPARAPLPGPFENKFREPHADALGCRGGRNRTVGGEQGQSLFMVAIFVKDLNGANPSLALAVVDLTQVEHRALDNASAGATPVFHDAPIAVLFAVFESPIAFQIHDG